jgi:hypothetical protein
MLFFLKQRYKIMAQSIRNQIVSRIYGRGRGWVFTPKDFTGDFSRNDVDAALFALERKGTIRRIIPGLYDYPKYSELLQEIVAPNIYSAAKALARKYNWTIFPEGNTVLNYLGLSTQLVAQAIYLSDGPTKKYDIGGMTLTFKHTTLAEAKVRRESSTLVVQAIKAIGEKQITEKFLKNLSSKYSADEWQKIKSDTGKVAEWIQNCIIYIADKLNGGK